MRNSLYIYDVRKRDPILFFRMKSQFIACDNQFYNYETDWHKKKYIRDPHLIIIYRHAHVH